MREDGWFLLAFIGAQIGLGVWVSRRVQTRDDYLLAGRSLGPTLCVFTIFATWFGAEACVGTAGRVHAEGLAGASGDPFGYGLCLLLTGLVFAGPLRRRGFTTLADLFRARFGPVAERVAALLMIPTSLFWAAAQLRAFGQVLSEVGGIELGWSIAVAATVVAAYTTVGGLLADAWTDLVQGLLLALGLVALGWLLLERVGSVSGALSALPAERLAWSPQSSSGLDIWEGWTRTALGSLVAQELIARVLASRSERVARWSAAGASGLYVALGMIPIGIGLLGTDLVGSLEDPEHMLPAVARELLPRGLYFVFSGAIVAAVLSTIDSCLLVSASLFVTNVLKFRPRSEGGQSLWYVRAIVLLAAGLATWMALEAESISGMADLASSYGSAGLVVLLCFGLFTTLGTPIAAVGSLLVGVLCSSVPFLPESSALRNSLPEWFSRYSFLVSLAASVGAFLLLSLMPPRRGSSRSTSLVA